MISIQDWLYILQLRSRCDETLLPYYSDFLQQDMLAEGDMMISIGLIFCSYYDKIIAFILHLILHKNPVRQT